MTTYRWEYMNQNKTVLKPFLKWAGGKGQLLADIRSSFPKGFGTNITKYAEPFIGGGAVLFDVLSNYELEEVYISDINESLINTYFVIRDNVILLIEKLTQYQNEYIPLDKENRKKYYYNKRNRFNDLNLSDALEDNLEKASLFIFLNKTCFNGLYRVNKKGEYNVPMGDYKNPCICDSENLVNVSNALKKVKIVCADYKESEKFIDDKTLVYFDPPYRPLNITSSFNSYTEFDFTDKEQQELAEYANRLKNKNAKVILSNSDPKNTNEQDTFF